MLSEHKQILDHVQKTLRKSRYIVTGRSTKALQLKVKCHEHGSGKSHRIDVDVLPAANFGKLGASIEKGKQNILLDKDYTPPYVCV